MEKTETELLKEISGKLDRLLGAIAIQGRDIDSQIKILTTCGFSSREIGALLSMHPVQVRQKRTKKGR